jgi:hypothetical protein
MVRRRALRTYSVRMSTSEDGGPVGERLDDGLHVPDRDALAQEVVEDALEVGDLDQLGHGLFDELGGLCAECLDEVVDLLAGEQLVGVLLDDLGDVCGQHAGGIDDGVVHGFGALALAGIDPPRVEAEGGLAGRLALEGAGGDARVHRHKAAGAEFALGDHGCRGP